MGNKNDILLVGLDDAYVRALSDALKHENIDIHVVNNPISGFEILLNETIDLTVISYHQSQIKWTEYLKLIQIVNPLIVNAVVFEGDEQTELEILGSQADLQISLQKSVAYGATLIRSSLDTLKTKVGRTDKNSIYLEACTTCGTLGVHLDTMQVVLDGIRLDVTATEFQILTYLINEKERIVSREDLLQLMYGEVYANKDYRNVDVHIKNLRSKIGYNTIQSIRGYGYKWVEVMQN